LNTKFPSDFMEFLSDITEAIQSATDFETLDQHRPNDFEVRNGSIFVKTDSSKPKFLRIPTKYFEVTFDKLSQDREISRKYMRNPLGIYRTSAISTLLSRLLYIVPSTKPIRFKVKE